MLCTATAIKLMRFFMLHWHDMLSMSNAWVALHRFYLSSLLLYETEAAFQCSAQTMHLCISGDCYQRINMIDVGFPL